MCTLIADELPVARRAHRCCACCGTIPVGHRYRRQRVVDGGDIWTWKAHELCDRIAIGVMAEYQLDCTDPVDDWEVRQILAAIFCNLFQT